MVDKIISIDFDGVIIENVFYRNFVNQGKPEKKEWWSEIIYFFDWLWTLINQTWRRPVVGSKEGLMTLKKKGYSLIMLTSRKSYLRKETIKWVKKWDFFDVYDKFYFNNLFIGAAESKIKNIEKIGSVIHIDDNWVTVQKIAMSFPKMEVWYINPSKSPFDKGDLSNIKVIDSWRKITKSHRMLG
jgi:hypothetical protein